MPAVTEQFVSEFLVQGFGEFSRSLNSADKMMGGLERSGGSAAGVLTNALGHALGSAIVGAANLATGAVTSAAGAVVNFARDGVAMAIEFESSMADLEIAASSTGLTFDELQQAAIGVGGDTRLLGVSASGAAEAMTGLFKSGLTATEIFGDFNGYMEEGAELGGALRASIDLAAATELDMVQASDLASVALASFGAELVTEEERANFVNEAMNNMVQAADASVAEVSGLAEALKMVGPAAGGAGLDIKEINNALAILSTRGIQGSMAGTSLNSMINSLRDLTPQATEALDGLGVAVRDTATGEMLPMVDIIGNFEDALDGMTAAEYDAALGAVFTSQGLRAMDTLLAGGVEGWDDMAKATEGAATMQEQAARKSQTLAGQLESLDGVIETIKIQAGDGLGPAIGQVIGMFTTLVEANGPAIVGFFETVGGVLEAFVGYIRLVVEDGDLLNDWLTGIPEAAQPFVEVLGGLILLFQDLISGAFGVDYPWEDIFPPTIADTIYAVIEAVTLLLETIMPYIEIAWQWISQNVQLSDVLIALGALLATVIVPAIASVVAGIVSFLAPIIAAIAIVAALRQAWETNFLGIRDAVQAVLLFLQEFITATLANIRAWWEENGAAIQANALMVWQNIQAFISTAIQTISTTVQTVLQAIQAFWQTHGANITAYVTNLWTLVKAIFVNAFTVIKSVVQAALAVLRGDWTAFGSYLRTAANAAWNTVVTTVKTIGANLVATVKSVLAAARDVWRSIDWGSVGSSIIKGIANGLANAKGFLVDAASSAARAALDAAKGFLGIQSPSKRMEAEVGEPAGIGVAVGLAKSIPAIQATMGEVVASIMPSSQTPTVNNFMTQTDNYNLTTQSMTRPGGLRMEFSAMAAGARTSI